MKYFIVPITCTITIFILSLISTPQVPELKIKFIDKIIHVLMYFTLVSTWIWAFFKKNQKKIIPFTTLLVIFASSVLYGILMEYLQYSLTTERNFEIPDIIANIIGCLFGVFLYQLIKNLRL